MQSIYWICFVGGGIFVVLAAIGGIDGAEIDVAADVGLVEPGFEVGLNQDVELIEPQDVRQSQRLPWRFNPLVLLSTLKFWTFGACFFGLTGLLLGLLQPERSDLSTFIIALLMGLFIGSMVAGVFHVLRLRAPTGMATPDDLIGTLGTVELPMDPERRGKIRVQFGDGSRELLARTSDQRPLALGESVVIVGVENHQVWVVAEDSLKSD